MMLQYIAFCSFLLFATGLRIQHPIPGIVGGKTVNIQDYPYQVQIGGEGKHFCGGAIVGNRHVITSATCAKNAFAYSPDISRITIRVNSSNINQFGDIYHVKDIVIHRKYKENIIDYDVSVFIVTEPFKFGSGIAAIPISNSTEAIQSTTKFSVTGWGQTRSGNSYSKELRLIEVPYIESTECQKLYKGITITERMICAGYIEGGKGPCGGDIGNPLAYKGSLYGIVSWGFGCGHEEDPGIYTSIPAVYDFVKYVINSIN